MTNNTHRARRVIGIRHTDDDKYIVTVNKADTDNIFDSLKDAVDCMETLMYLGDAKV